jgi:hypothetical protein
MIIPADAIDAYLGAKDGNRPHLMAYAFAPDATLSMLVKADGMAFPPLSQGRAAIADVLVRRFGQVYDNVYTICLAPPPLRPVAAFSCDWLVAMTEKASGTVRVGCGRYDWQFAPASGLAERLCISIEAMQTLAPEALDGVMRWIAALSYPWCGAGEAVAGAAGVDGIEAVKVYLLRNTIDCM